MSTRLAACLWCVSRVPWLMAVPSPALAESALAEPFDAPHPDLWTLDAGEPGKAVIADGRLTLDLSEPKGGKWATAELHQGITLPARVEWDQCLAHNSPHTYFSGLLIWCLADKGREQLSVGLGGGGLKDCMFLGDQHGPDGVVEEGVWYRFSLDVQATAQSLTVTRRGEAEPLVRLSTNVGLTRSPFMLTCFQNDARLGSLLPDTYEQDRGVTWIDNLAIRAEKTAPATPPPPGTTYPYRIPVVFNRATRWVTPADGLSHGSIAYEAVGWMPLTGPQAVSRWLRLERWNPRDWTAFPEQPCIEDVAEQATVFRLPPGGSEATFALRALQWGLGQHSTLEWTARATGVEWDLEITATDGVRPFTWRLWQGSAASQTLNLAAVYAKAGRPNRHAEVDFLVRLRAQSEAEAPHELWLHLGLQRTPALLSRSPVVTQAEIARRDGVALEAILVDDDGRLVTARDGRMTAEIAGRTLPLRPVGDGGVWRAVARDLPPGEHRATLTSRTAQGSRTEATVDVTVSDLPFLSHYDPATRSYATPDGHAAGPLLGDLIAWIPYAKLSTDERQLALGRDTAEVTLTKWRSVPQSDLDRYVQYMAESGVRVLRITPNVSVAEYYLDAGGHLAPHGFEQLSYLLAAARRNGLRCVINLTHYPYLYPGTGSNPPVAQYFEAGYRRDFDWTSDEMWGYLSAYLAELLGYIGDDPAVMAYTITGENDQVLPIEWVNRAHDLIKAHAPSQMVVLEQGGSILQCRDADPGSYAAFKPASDGGVGFRTYETYRYPNDCLMATAIRFYNLARPGFFGEVACGVNRSPQFVTKLRDSMGLALTLQQPMAISWCAALLEDERRTLTQASEKIDWTAFRRAKPPVAVIAEKPDKEQLQRLVQYEEALASVPLDYELIRPDADRQGYALVLDARAGFVEPALDAVPAPVRVSPGNHTSYALAEGGRQLVAYIRNATHYEILLCDVGRNVERCRLGDQPRDVSIELPGLAAGCRFSLRDAATGEELASGATDPASPIALASTSADLVLLVTPR